MKFLLLGIAMIGLAGCGHTFNYAVFNNALLANYEDGMKLYNECLATPVCDDKRRCTSEGFCETIKPKPPKLFQ